MAKELKYRWTCPAHWLTEKAETWDKKRLLSEFKSLIITMDSDTLQDLFQSEMDVDGYFKQLKS